MKIFKKVGKKIIYFILFILLLFFYFLYSDNNEKNKKEYASVLKNNTHQYIDEKKNIQVIKNKGIKKWDNLNNLESFIVERVVDGDTVKIKKVW